MDLTQLSITEAIQQLRSGEISPLDLVKSHIERIEQFDSELNCYITFTPEHALKEAKEAENTYLVAKRQHSFQSLPPLLGIPIAHKDIFQTKGLRTTAGSRILENFIPKEDSTVVAMLKKAGAISLGKLNMHEIALGVQISTHITIHVKTHGI